MWGDVEEPDRPAIYGTYALLFWITNTHTHTQYVILTTFSRQQWLRECASLLRVFIREFLVLLILSAIQ